MRLPSRRGQLEAFGKGNRESRASLCRYERRGLLRMGGGHRHYRHSPHAQATAFEQAINRWRGRESTWRQVLSQLEGAELVWGCEGFPLNLGRSGGGLRLFCRRRVFVTPAPNYQGPAGAGRQTSEREPVPLPPTSPPTPFPCRLRTLTPPLCLGRGRLG